MRRKPKQTTPFATIGAVDHRLAELATLLRSASLTDSYRATLHRETDKLLDRRLVLTVRELVQTG